MLAVWIEHSKHAATQPSFEGSRTTRIANSYPSQEIQITKLIHFSKVSTLNGCLMLNLQLSFIIRYETRHEHVTCLKPRANRAIISPDNDTLKPMSFSVIEIPDDRPCLNHALLIYIRLWFYLLEVANDMARKVFGLDLALRSHFGTFGICYRR